MQRRNFLQWLGWGCTGTALSVHLGKSPLAAVLPVDAPAQKLKEFAPATSFRLVQDIKITSITSTRYPTRHPRKIGRNSFRDHGAGGSQPLVRVRTDAGIEGIGSELHPDALGKKLGDLLQVQDDRLVLQPSARAWIGPASQAVLLDLVGKLTRQPAAEWFGPVVRREVPCYDGSIYMRELDDGDAVIAEDTLNGLSAGHLSFKVKIGRGNWLKDRGLGYARDLWAIQTVHDTAGKGSRILVDANNYYTPEESVRLVRDNASVGFYWMEEMFKEDQENQNGYRMLRAVIREQKLGTLLADGESGRGDGDLLKLIREGVIQVSEPDIRTLGIFDFPGYAEMIRPYGALIAPHAWAKHLGVLEICLLGMVVSNFAMVEDCRLTSDVVLLPGLRIRNGLMTLDPSPGLGVVIDEDAYARQCASQEKTVKV